MSRELGLTMGSSATLDTLSIKMALAPQSMKSAAGLDQRTRCFRKSDGRD
jgi:hypothetical protein